MTIEVDPAFASSELPQIIDRYKKTLKSLQLQLDAADELAASDIAKEDPEIMAIATVAQDNVARSIRVHQFQLAGYETRYDRLKKAADGPSRASGQAAR